MKYSTAPADGELPPSRQALDEFCKVLRNSMRIQDEIWEEFMSATTRKRFRDWLTEDCWFFKNASKHHIEYVITYTIGED